VLHEFFRVHLLVEPGRKLGEQGLNLGVGEAVPDFFPLHLPVQHKISQSIGPALRGRRGFFWAQNTDKGVAQAVLVDLG
jgi:hypothetical protein